MRTQEVLEMNEFEENVYKNIKNELVQSVIDKKIDTYFTNRNELTHYYNVCEMDDKYLIEYSSDNRIRVTTYKLV